MATEINLPSDPKARKGIPIVTGVMDYFPLALAEVAKVSVAGNEQHNPGQPLHWAKEKSTDHADCIGRHLVQRGTIDTDGGRHSAKMAWRALALLETELEAEQAKQNPPEITLKGATDFVNGHEQGPISGGPFKLTMDNLQKNYYSEEAIENAKKVLGWYKT